jgi:tetratricopeptide (TPR) repeat protein
MTGTLVSTYMHKARILLEQGRPGEAEQQLMQALGSEPENHQAMSLLTRCKYDQRKYKEGTDIIKNAISLFPVEDYYHYLLSFGYYQLHDRINAKQSLNQAIKLNPYASDYFGLLALIFLEEKQFEAALNTANEGLALDPSNITCLNARSTALNKLKRTQDAIDTMQSALMHDPENDFTHTTVGWNLLEKGKHSDAAKHFSEALRINPNLENARAGLKESLKSKIPVYRWLLQYSFWVNNRGKRARWIVPLGIFILVRLVAATFDLAGGIWSNAAAVVLGAYLLFVLTSWIINPLANFFLLFNDKGRYAVTVREKWNAILLIACVAVALVFGTLSFVTYKPDMVFSPFVVTAVVALTMSIPLGHMDFPIRFKNNTRLQWYSMLLVCAGLMALFLSFINIGAALVALGIYALGFILYTWMNIWASN